MQTRLIVVVLSGCGFSAGVSGEDDVAQLPDGAVVDRICPTTYVTAASSRYRFVDDRVDWTTAESRCAADGPGIHLAVIESIAEQDTIRQIVPRDTETWIGLSDLETEASWVWVTPNQLAIDGWYKGQPNQDGHTPDYDCADWLDNGDSDVGWRDEQCATLKSFLCECDGLAVR